MATRKGRKKPIPETPSIDWRLLLRGNAMTIIAFLISALAWIAVALYSAGWIPGIAKQTDLSMVTQQIVDIKGGLDRLANEFSETRTEIVKAASSIARIEGRMEASAAARAVPPPRPRPKPVVKPKGLFE